MAYVAGEGLVCTLLVGQSECRSSGGQAEEVDDVLHVGCVGFDGVIGRVRNGLVDGVADCLAVRRLLDS